MLPRGCFHFLPENRAGGGGGGESPSYKPYRYVPIGEGFCAVLV